MIFAITITMEPIDSKIRTIISHFNLNNYSFSKRIGVTGTTIDSIVNGRPQKDGTRKKTKPGYDVLSAIINEFDINPEYLFGKSDTLLATQVNRTPTYSGIPKVVSTAPDGNENVVFVTTKARAGYLDGYGDPEYIERLPTFHMPQLSNGTYRCFEVQGNSMSHTLFDGDLVFGRYVEDFSDIKNDQIHIIVSKNDGVVLKRIINRIEEHGKLILKSDNNDGNFPTYSINAEDVMEIWYITMYASKRISEPVDVHERLDTLERKVLQLEQQLIPNRKH